MNAGLVTVLRHVCRATRSPAPHSSLQRCRRQCRSRFRQVQSWRLRQECWQQPRGDLAGGACDPDLSERRDWYRHHSPADHRSDRRLRLL